MSRKPVAVSLGAALVVALLSNNLVGRLLGADPPNILWITAEDMSPTLGCYGDAYAITPNIDALAKRSVRYSHAFATAPVCSPARACLINGCIATSQGAHQMRSTFPIPDSLRGFPSLLRQLGYFTTNNAKTDYNSGNSDAIVLASWDQSSEVAHWGARQDGQPFFAVFNLNVSHQSRTMVWSYEQFQSDVQSELAADQIHDPLLVPLPPYYPDTPLIRKTLARYYDCVTVMDKQVGGILQQLQDDGLADDTIVFFYSDHGSGMPRHKRVLLDSGTKVPMLVHFPDKYARWAPVAAGGTTDQLVSFEDFGPTVLSLAGSEDQPAGMLGRPFLGSKRTSPRDYVYGHRDRVDEIMDCARSVRDKRYLYIRNYMPHLGYNQPSAWVDQAEMQHEFYRLADPAKMTRAQWQFAAPTRPIEELYDCDADRWNLKNLADSDSHQDVLRRLRKANRDHILSTRDLGFLPETEQWEIARSEVPMRWARSDAYKLPQILEAAEQVGTAAIADFQQGLTHTDPAIRYWSAVGLSASRDLTRHCVRVLSRALQDQSEIVRIEAANALARHGYKELALPALTDLFKHDDLCVVLYAARTVELLADPSVHAQMQALFDRFEHVEGDPAWFIRFTTTGYLSRVKP